MEDWAVVLMVDTNVWAAFFNGEATSYSDRLDLALANKEDLVTLPIIITEVLQGFRTERGFLAARDLLLGLPVLVPSIATHVAAALLFRRMRAKGVTLRGAVDCIIAQTCIEHGVELLSPDGDFRRIAKHARLIVCEV